METDRIASLEKLYSAVVADVLDTLGYRNQCLGPAIRALTPLRRVCGKVYTARAEGVSEIPENPYELELAAIGRMKMDDVLLVDTGEHQGSAFWGELLSTACQAKGVRGIVMNGCTRDMWALEKMEFPVFGIGITPADSKGRLDVVEIGEPIEIDGVSICSGDLVLGDPDGVVIIPAEAADEAIRLALEKVSGENTVRDELAAGVPVEEVFEKHGIL